MRRGLNLKVVYADVPTWDSWDAPWRPRPLRWPPRTALWLLVAWASANGEARS